jgi:hypothetical protein
MSEPLLDHDPLLAEVVRRLVDAYQPERIYLFGSVVVKYFGGREADQ